MDNLGGDNQQQSTPAEIYANVRNKALEEAALVCEARKLDSDYTREDQVVNTECDSCASEIRALKTEEK